MRVQEQVRQPQRRERQQPQRSVRPLLLGRALRIASRRERRPRHMLDAAPAHPPPRRSPQPDSCSSQRASRSSLAPQVPDARPQASLRPASVQRPRRRSARAVLRPDPTGDLNSASREQPRRDLPQPRPPLAARRARRALPSRHLRGASDLPPGEQPPDRPLALLATAVPRLISLAVAANVLHILPTAATRCARRSPTSCSQQSTRPPPAACTAATSRSTPAVRTPAPTRPRNGCPTSTTRRRITCTLSRRQPTRPPLVQHAQEAGRYTAIAIGALDRDARMAPEAISDCLAHLLTVCVFAEAAAGKPSA